MNRKLLRRWIPLTFVFASLLFLAACEDDDPEPSKTPPTTNMGFPQSLTGNETTPPALTSSVALYVANNTDTRSANGEPHCFFDGTGNDDPFRDGYNMTKFLVSAVAQWQCITDFLIIGFAALPIPADGTFVEITPDPNDPDDNLTGIRITDNSSSQRTIELFVDGNTTTAGVYLTWNVGAGSTEGRLIVTSDVMDDPSDPEAPDALRMDFATSGTTQTADMIISFPSTNPWAEAFRIDAVKTLADSSFVVRGIMSMKDQWDPTYAGSAVPTLKMFGVSDSAGLGAAMAQFADIGTNFDLGGGLTLGSYDFTVDDRYYFLADGTDEWIDKSVTSATYAGGSRTVTGGTVPSLSSIESTLGLAGGYFTSPCSAVAGMDCTALFTSIFVNGFGGKDSNTVGPEPTDSRMAALDSGSFLANSCPGGAGSCTFDDTDVFEQTFTPSN